MLDLDFSMYACDPQMPGIGQLTETRVLELISECIDHRWLDACVQDYRIGNVRYAPRDKFVLGLTAPNSNRFIGLRIYPPGGLAERLAATRRRGAQSAFSIPSLGAVGWVFPWDKKLNLEFLRESEALDEWLRARGYGALQSFRLIRYVPEHSYTALVQTAAADGAAQTLYLKVQPGRAGEHTQAVLQYLAGALQQTSIAVPDNVSYHGQHHALLQAALPRNTQRRASDAEVVAALTALHRLPWPAGLSVKTLAPQILFAELTRLLDAIFPAWTAPIRRLYGAIANAQTYAAPAVPLHGDVHLGNVFPLVDGRIGIIDFDSFRPGDAAVDLCSYFAFTVWIRLKAGASIASSMDDFETLLELYNSRCNRPIDRAHAYRTLAQVLLLERIRRGLKRAKITGFEDLQTFYELAEHCVVQAEERLHA